MLEFENVPVQDMLSIELVPRGALQETNLPVICGLEVLRRGTEEIVRGATQDEVASTP